jgi:23S rRNA (guanine745-N1)-methyltransferase
MSIDSTWLRCPNCFSDLDSIDARTLGCVSGHRFDVGKHGAVTLLAPRAPRTVGDSREMLEARHDLLGSDMYLPIAVGIAQMSTSRVTAREAVRVADLGCGTGYYAAHLAHEIPNGTFLLADRSPIAVRMAMRIVPAATGVVLDLWRPLSVRDATADLAINVFAPRNPREFARIVRPSGVLIVVVPTGDHLQELRMAGDGMLDIPRDKDEHVTEQLGPAGFVLEHAERIQYPAQIDASQRAALVGMGPSAHHTQALGDADVRRTDLDRVTVSVDVLAFRRRSPDAPEAS